MGAGEGLGSRVLGEGNGVASLGWLGADLHGRGVRNCFTNGVLIGWERLGRWWLLPTRLGFTTNWKIFAETEGKVMQPNISRGQLFRSAFPRQLDITTRWNIFVGTEGKDCMQILKGQSFKSSLLRRLEFTKRLKIFAWTEGKVMQPYTFRDQVFRGAFPGPLGTITKWNTFVGKEGKGTRQIFKGQLYKSAFPTRVGFTTRWKIFAGTEGKVMQPNTQRSVV